MLDYFFIFFFKIFGWKLRGGIPRELKKTICIVSPHAKTIDFLIGLGARAMLQKRDSITINFLGKAELFKGSFGWLFEGLGGIPVDRFNNNDMVQSVVDLINSKETIHIALAPEGTRKQVSSLRTGFYYMARNAHLPLIMIAFDYENREVFFNKPFYLSGDISGDLVKIAQFYNSFGGVKKEWIGNILNDFEKV